MTQNFVPRNDQKADFNQNYPKTSAMGHRFQKTQLDQTALHSSRKYRRCTISSHTIRSTRRTLLANDIKLCQYFAYSSYMHSYRYTNEYNEQLALKTHLFANKLLRSQRRTFSPNFLDTLLDNIKSNHIVL